MRVIPRLDIKNENVIKGINFEGLRVVGNPNKIAKKYYEDGADELIYSDCVASLYGRNSLTELVKNAVKDIFIPITIAGGIRSEVDANLLMKSGSDKLAINSELFSNEKLANLLVQKFGSQSIVLSIQAKKITKNSWEAYKNFGRDKTGMDVMDWVKKMTKYNFGELLLTSIDADGICGGFDVELFEKVSKIVKIPIIACGGFGKLDHIKELKKYANIDAIALSKALHYEKITIKEIKDFIKKLDE
ncbi:imidazole glycerol phosphate synthase subunit HisF [Candidatus Pelagibacter sp. Uisw_106]|jgi:cyclase|uniref:imidazole glycerol phosphate synthase subunit HisF n=1 Tax=Candidatus Pelagibacter sp. Uisw_106 TaxID=3230984 RepID=UPI0039E965D8